VSDQGLSQRRRDLVLRAFRLSGVVPLGLFVVVHAALNARALAGDGAFLDATRAFGSGPALVLVETVLVFAPLLFHAAVGLWIMVARVPLAAESPYPPALRMAVRVTGVLAIAFLAMHLPELRFRTLAARPDGAALLATLDADLSTMRYGLPLRGVAYLLGSACVCFHLAAGLWGYFATTPRGQDGRARRFAAWWSVAVGVILWVVFANVAVYHATGARLLGGRPLPLLAPAPCPAPARSAP
jgi:succinate dehydrogenase / fumarate reductase cytochrome b subunit